MNKSVQALVKARELLADEAHWTQKSYAVDSQGVLCDPRALQAHQWCLLGALDKAQYDLEIVDIMEFCDMEDRTMAAVRDAIGPERSITHFNDTRDHATVLKALDAAIAIAQG